MPRLEKVDLDGENWHSGMTEIKSNGSILEYNKSYRDDCIRKDELADVVYLRSGDRQKAFGVITNRRANYWTLGDSDCIDNSDIPPPEHSNPDEEEYTEQLQTFGSVSPESGNNRLRIRNMALGFLGLPKEYKIKYYSPYDQVNSIKEETRWAPQLTLDFPEMDTLDIMLFEVFPMGEDFKSMKNDTTSLKESIKKKPRQVNSDNIKIYPNPNEGAFIVLIEKSEKVKFIQILDNLGKQVDLRNTVSRENHYRNSGLKPGVYLIEIMFEDKVIREKIIIN